GTCQVCTTLPLSARMRSISTVTGAGAVMRYEKVMPRLDPAKATLLLVAVSSDGPPGSRGPGTGESWPVVGGGGGGGRMPSGLVRAVVVTVPLVTSARRPLI